MSIAIITGGETAERAISIESAKNVARAIDFAETKTFIFPEQKADFLEQVHNFEIAIPMIHGLGGEDGELQQLLESHRIPYIFSGITAHKIAIDKIKTKEVVHELGFLVPKEFTVGDIEYPIFAKPRFGGSSIASKLCNSIKELHSLIAENPGVDLMFEEPIKGREFTVGVVESGGETLALPVTEIIPKGQFFDFVSKYDTEHLAQEICPAKIDEQLSASLQRIALLVHKKIGVRHMSRSDFIVNADGKVYFLEINTILGLTSTSLVPKMLKEANVSLGELLREWCSI